MSNQYYSLPVETVHHLEMCPQVFLSKVVQHTSVHQALHEVASVLRQAETGQPLVPDPLMVHVTIC